MCVFTFSTNFVRNTSHSKKNWARYDQKCILVFMWSTRYSCPTLMNLNFLDIFSKNIKISIFHENPSSGSRVVRCGQRERRTDMTTLIVAFRNFAKRPKKWHWNKFCFEYFGFLMSKSLHQCFILIFSYMLLLPEGRTGKAREPPKKLRSFGNPGALIRKVLSLSLKGLPGSDPTPPSQKNSQETTFLWMGNP